MSEKLFSRYRDRVSAREDTAMSISEFLELCKTDPGAYATAPERMLRAIGPSEIIDTATHPDPRMARIFMNRKIQKYAAFEAFYGMEETIEKLVSFFKHAAQGLEERKQVLYLLGPVGGGKSSLVERLKELFESQPMYTLKATVDGVDQISPMFESPFGLFDINEDAAVLEDEYGIPRTALRPIMSPWASKRLKEFNNDITKFKVVKIWPSQLKRIGIAHAEPGDPNNQDISTLVGKVDIRKLEDFSQNDPDAYSYSGALNITAQGLLEYAEMFKSDITMINPLLTATQDGYYNGTEGFAAMPFHGMIVAHSNEAEWEMFRQNKRNEAFIDRISLVKVPYCLRITEEELIYQKLLKASKLKDAQCAPGTLAMLAQFCVLTRAEKPDNSTLWSKVEIYDGKNLKDKDPKAKSLQEYRDNATVNEGMKGMSTRFAYKILSKTFNYGTDEIAANPVHLMYVLEKQIPQEHLDALGDEYIAHIKGILAPNYAQYLQDEIQKAYLESYSEYGQNLFDRYIMFADAWIQNIDFRDPDTAEMYDRETLNNELEKIEKAAGISNAKDFRSEVVNFVLRASRNNGGNNPSWTSYEKLRIVIEKKMFSNTEDLLPVIAFSKKSTTDEEKKHHDFVQRMVDKGYTEKQVRLLVDWFQRYKRNS